MWFLPSRGRPARCAEAVRSFAIHGASSGAVLVCDDDPLLADYLAIDLPDGWTVETFPASGPLERLNLALERFPGKDWYGFTADDQLAETDGFEGRLIAAAGVNGIASCQDDWQAQAGRISGAVIVGGELVRAAGFMAVPGCFHWFGFDDYLETLGRDLNCWTVLPDVMVRHNHARNGKALPDATYRDSDEKGPLDQTRWHEFRETEYPALYGRLTREGFNRGVKIADDQRPLKIAVYGIAKNEAALIGRMIRSAADADYIVITDTGSTDNTIEVAREAGATVCRANVVPFRFDDARNASLANVPADADICISMDCDEVLPEGWREKLLAAWVPGHTTMLRYRFVWSWNEDGTPAATYWHMKVHSRHGFRWRYPCHELPMVWGGAPYRETWTDQFEIHQFADASKPRTALYTGLLEVGAQEAPDDPRLMHYLGREYIFAGRNDEGLNLLAKHVQRNDVWHSEKAASWRYMAQANIAKQDFGVAYTCAINGFTVSPNERECLVMCARICGATEQWLEAYAWINRALAIKERPRDSYLCEAWAWNHEPHALAAMAASKLGYRREVVASHLEAALTLAPGNQDLIREYEKFSAPKAAE